MTKVKKRTKKRKLRLTLMILILLMLLVLLWDRIGSGSGNLLFFMESSPSQETPVPGGIETPGKKEVVITISETTIQLDETTYTLESLESYLEASESDTLFVLVDDQANNALFINIENLLKERQLTYVIQD
jgi:biopolymer transport protein ExbD